MATRYTTSLSLLVVFVFLSAACGFGQEAAIPPVCANQVDSYLHPNDTSYNRCVGNDPINRWTNVQPGALRDHPTLHTIGIPNRTHVFDCLDVSLYSWDAVTSPGVVHVIVIIGAKSEAQGGIILWQHTASWKKGAGGELASYSKCGFNLAGQPNTPMFVVTEGVYDPAVVSATLGMVGYDLATQ